jgi:hypothetical protein
MSVGSWSKSTSGYTTQGNWTGVSSNSTGEKCIATNNQNTNIWISNDYGVSWSVSSNSPTSDAWGSVTISQSGNKMATCEDIGATTFNIYLYTTVSNTWVNIATSGTGAPGTTLQWTSVCFSIDENSLAACDGSATVWIYDLTTNSWTNPPDVAGNQPRCNKMSSNIYGFMGIGRNNWMYTIYGSGSSYTTGIIDNNNSNIYDLTVNPAWTFISSSLDGNTIVACATGNEYIYVGTLSISPTYYWTFVKQTAAGSGDWQVVEGGPDVVSIAACKRDGVGSVPGEIWVGNKSYGSTTYAWQKQNMQNGSPLNGDWISISRSTDPNQFTKFITLTKQTNPGEQTGIWVFTSYQTANNAQQPTPCFKKDSKILTDKGYKPIQDLRKGDLIKTFKHDFKPIDMIGKRDIYHPGSTERIKNQLYKCSKQEYPEIFEDLVITGCHSILVDSFVNEKQKKTVIEVNGNSFVTDNKYRLPACADERATVYEIPGTYTIYHLALENNDYYMNYGIYANGLLVETCSKRYLKELSNMTLL